MHPRTSFIESSSVEGQPLIPRGELYQQPYLPQAAAFVPPLAAPPSWAAPNAAEEPCPLLTVATVGKASATDDDDSNAKHQVDLPPALQLTEASLRSGFVASPFVAHASGVSQWSALQVPWPAQSMCEWRRVCASGSACARRPCRFGSAAGLAACHVIGSPAQQHGSAIRLPDVDCASRTGAVLPGAVPMLPLHWPAPREEGVWLCTANSPLLAPLPKVPMQTGMLLSCWRARGSKTACMHVLAGVLDASLAQCVCCCCLTCCFAFYRRSPGHARGSPPGCCAWLAHGPAPSFRSAAASRRTRLCAARSVAWSCAASFRESRKGGCILAAACAMGDRQQHKVSQHRLHATCVLLLDAEQH